MQHNSFPVPPKSEARRGTTFSSQVIPGVVLLTDAFFIFASGLGIHAAYVGFAVDTYSSYLATVALTAFSLIAVMYLSKLYQFEAIIHPFHHTARFLVAFGAVFLSVVALGFALKVSADFSRVWFFSWVMSSISLILLGRALWFFTLFRLARSGKLTRNIALVGMTRQAQRLIRHLQQASEPWNHVVGVFADQKDEDVSGWHSVPYMGSLDDLIAYSRTHRLDDVVITLPWSDERHMTYVVEKLSDLPVDIRLGSDMAGMVFAGRAFSFLAGVPMLDISSKPMEGWNGIVKAVEDRLLALLLLVLLSPVLLVISLAIRLESRGPVLFRQDRHGFNNQTFKVCKFRSMYHDRPMEEGVPQATQDDPRVTKVGAFLRRTSLDELPQLFNVLIGSMSLVGPRPHAVQHNEDYAQEINGYFARHKVKPGITGWAQVNGLRGETDTLEKMESRVEYDLFYIENWSVAMDMKILFMTAFVVLFQKNAY